MTNSPLADGVAVDVAVARADDMVAMLPHLGWRAERVDLADLPGRPLQAMPGLVVCEPRALDRWLSGVSGCVVTRQEPFHHAVIVAIGEPDPSVISPLSDRVDAWLTEGFDRRALDECLAQCCGPENETLDRLADVLGYTEIILLAWRFRDQLIEALGDVETSAFACLAHRVAGMAGTLGYRKLGVAWNAPDLIAADDPVLRSLTRRTILDLARAVPRLTAANASETDAISRQAGREGEEDAGVAR